MISKRVLIFFLALRGHVFTNYTSMFRLKSLAIPAAFFCLVSTLVGAASERRVLVYTKNQTGTNEAGKKLYVHDNLAASVAAIKKLGEENGFVVDASEDPSI